MRVVRYFEENCVGMLTTLFDKRSCYPLLHIEGIIHSQRDQINEFMSTQHREKGVKWNLVDDSSGQHKVNFAAAELLKRMVRDMFLRKGVQIPRLLDIRETPQLFSQKQLNVLFEKVDQLFRKIYVSSYA